MERDTRVYIELSAGRTARDFMTAPVRQRRRSGVHTPDLQRY
ncbi:hypothetical protein BSU04_31615 [Caballeronia sordidicola]|uniref:Uncharacterized protein n=1 Tax=Caballeronia sordidicola TaxID=196367 RepID=A0A226WTP1_CABSO|nr:hypothetical protein BSU04_31615 [Caballeronia sordidicola]